MSKTYMDTYMHTQHLHSNNSDSSPGSENGDIPLFYEALTQRGASESQPPPRRLNTDTCNKTPSSNKGPITSTSKCRDSIFYFFFHCSLKIQRGMCLTSQISGMVTLTVESHGNTLLEVPVSIIYSHCINC